MPNRPQHELEVRPEDRSDHEVLIRIFREEGDGPSRRNQLWIDGWQIPPAMRVDVRENTALNEVMPNGTWRQYEPGDITITIEATLVIHGSRSEDVNRELYRIEMVDEPGAEPIEMDEDSLTLPTPEEIIERVVNETGAWRVTPANKRRMLHLALRYAGYA